MNKDQQRSGQEGPQQHDSRDRQQPRSSAFKEPADRDQKSTQNPEEMAALEQERKETLTERD